MTDAPAGPGAAPGEGARGEPEGPHSAGGRSALGGGREPDVLPAAGVWSSRPAWPEEPVEVEPPPDPRKPSAWRAIRRGVGITYDYLGTSLLASFIVFLIGVGALAALLPLTARAGVLQVPLLAAVLTPLAALLLGGVYRLADRMLSREDPSPLDLAWGALSGWRLLLRLGAANLLLFGVLAANLYFYANLANPSARLLAVPFLYALGFQALTALYQPALVARQGIGPLKALRRSALLVLDNLLFSLALGAFALALLLLCLLTVLPMALLWPVLHAVICLAATDDLLAKYDALEAEEELSGQREGAKGSSGSGG